MEVNHYDHSRMDHSFIGIYNCGYSCHKHQVSVNDYLMAQMYVNDKTDKIIIAYDLRERLSFYGAKEILLSQKDIGNVDMLKLYPIYMLPFIVEDLSGQMSDS